MANLLPMYLGGGGGGVTISRAIISDLEVEVMEVEATIEESIVATVEEPIVAVVEEPIEAETC